MKNIEELLTLWLYCQTKLTKVVRWSKYVSYENGKPARHNGIRRQNVSQHTLSKFFAVSMLFPALQRIFGKKIDYNLLLACIAIHDFGEGLRGTKYDILADQKKDSHDLEEYLLTMKFMEDSGLRNEEIKIFFEKAFLLQFALTSCSVFPPKATEIFKAMGKNKIEIYTAILFQILEKWEYHFYAYENRKKHPTIFSEVSSRNSIKILEWINKYPKRYHEPLKEVFLY